MGFVQYFYQMILQLNALNDVVFVHLIQMNVYFGRVIVQIPLNCFQRKLIYVYNISTFSRF